MAWGKRKGLEWLITESAGLCNRCSPYINGIPAICVIDAISGVNTPRKIGPKDGLFEDPAGGIEYTLE